MGSYKVPTDAIITLVEAPAHKIGPLRTPVPKGWYIFYSHTNLWSWGCSFEQALAVMECDLRGVRPFSQCILREAIEEHHLGSA